ncbi:MAG TPA: MgtC/SapB family protein [Coleofasciculaceae cyanobacterium]|jgi:putative Mg2+ transporter-C (MgtC) family protein
MTITWTTFAIRLLVGFFLAVGIGIERQWLKTRAVLKTNVLVTLGSAMFVMLSIMTPGDASPTRIAAQIVSGVGFLGGGVILREGASVKGINTAATLWCAAAIGSLVGSGFLVQAYVSTLAVVGANLLLRPLVEAFKQQQEDQDAHLSLDDTKQMNNAISPLSSIDSLALATAKNYNRYDCHLLCSLAKESQVLELVLKFAREQKLTIVGMQSKNLDNRAKSGAVEVEIKISFAAQSSQANFGNLNEIIKLLKTEAQVNSISWQSLLK